MKKFKWLILVALLAIAMTLAALEGGALGAAAGASLGLAFFGVLIVCLIKLDALEFPEDSALEALAWRLKKPQVPSVPVEPSLSQGVLLEMRTHTVA